MINVNVWFRNEKHACEINLSEPIETFRYIVYSLTQVPPESQKIIGIANGLLTDNTSLSSLNPPLLEGDNLLLWGFTDDDYALNSEVLNYKGSSDWKEMCSRITFPSSSIIQPVRFIRGGNINGICSGCAANCWNASELSPNAMSENVVCCCSSLKEASGGECIFSESIGTMNEVDTHVTHSLKRSMYGASMMVNDNYLQNYQPTLNKEKDRGLQDIFNRIKSAQQTISMYERKDLQDTALKTIPVKELLKKAADRFENGKQEAKSFEDQMIRELLHWFKHGFFKWVNAPACSSCGGPTSGIGGAQPNLEEQAGLAGRVEIYKCNNNPTCPITRFPRYNHPGKLLSFRQGRCGEWANAFTLCAVSMGFNARYVSDWTDHVWTEVWSDNLNKWLHCDSCEDLCDGPLVYESGWGKKLNYIIACSPDEVVDVTRRYTKKWIEVLDRRTLANEVSLERSIYYLDKSCRNNTNKLRSPLAIFEKRRWTEIKFLDENIKTDSGIRSAAELVGRISGSREWVNSRKEDGSTNGPEKNDVGVNVNPVYGYEMVNTVKNVGNICAFSWNGAIYSIDNGKFPLSISMLIFPLTEWKVISFDLNGIDSSKLSLWETCKAASISGNAQNGFLFIVDFIGILWGLEKQIDESWKVSYLSKIELKIDDSPFSLTINEDQAFVSTKFGYIFQNTDIKNNSWKLIRNDLPKALLTCNQNGILFILYQENIYLYKPSIPSSKSISSESVSTAHHEIKVQSTTFPPNETIKAEITFKDKVTNNDIILMVRQGQNPVASLAANKFKTVDSLGFKEKVSGNKALLEWPPSVSYSDPGLYELSYIQNINSETDARKWDVSSTPISISEAFEVLPSQPITEIKLFFEGEKIPDGYTKNPRDLLACLGPRKIYLAFSKQASSSIVTHFKFSYEFSCPGYETDNTHILHSGIRLHVRKGTGNPLTNVSVIWSHIGDKAAEGFQLENLMDKNLSLCSPSPNNWKVSVHATVHHSDLLLFLPASNVCNISILKDYIYAIVRSSNDESNIYRIKNPRIPSYVEELERKMRIEKEEREEKERMEKEESDRNEAVEATKRDEFKKKIFGLLFAQLQKGCGKPSCTNLNCASNPSVVAKPPNEAFLLSMQLIQTLAEDSLCSKHEPLAKAMKQLRAINSFAVSEECISLVIKYIDKIIENPEDKKFQRIKCSNKTFHSQIWSIKGGPELMASIGFIKEIDVSKEVYVVLHENIAKSSVILEKVRRQLDV